MQAVDKFQKYFNFRVFRADGNSHSCWNPSGEVQKSVSVSVTSSKPTVLPRTSRRGIAMNGPSAIGQGDTDTDPSMHRRAQETPHQSSTTLQDLPSDVVQKIFTLLDAQSLSAALEVSKAWSRHASEYTLWENLDLELYDSVEEDKHLVHLLNKLHGGEWYSVVRKIWRIMATMGRGENLRGIPLIAHHISGKPGNRLPVPPLFYEESYLNVSRLQDVVLPDAALFYLEPYAEHHYCHYNKVRDSLKKRGMAKILYDIGIETILCPPCEYVANEIGYKGPNMLVIRQRSTVLGNWPYSDC